MLARCAQVSHGGVASSFATPGRSLFYRGKPVSLEAYRYMSGQCVYGASHQTQQDEEATDEIWKRTGTVDNIECCLRVDLKACFESKGLGDMKLRHSFFTDKLKQLGAAGNIMGYQTFLAFINETRSTPLKNDHRKQLEMMLTNIGTKNMDTSE
jgi:hypothetical protein